MSDGRRAASRACLARAAGRAAKLTPAGLVVAFIASSCAEPTQIRLTLRSDALEARGAELQVYVREAGDALDVPVVETSGPWSSPTEMGDLVVVPRKDRSASVRVRAVLAITKQATACTVAEPDGCIFARREFSFVRGRSLEVPVVLHAACIGVPCDEESTCNALGRCVSARLDAASCAGGACDVEGEGPPPVGGAPVASSDGGTDAGSQRDASDDDSRECRALSFDGVARHATIADAPEFDGLGDMTVEAWIRPAPSEALTVGLVSHWSPNNAGWILGMSPKIGGVMARVRSAGGEASASVMGVITAGVWQHVALVRDGAMVAAYVGGVRVASAPSVLGPTLDYAGAVRIGAAQDPPSGASFFAGLIREVRVSRVARYKDSFVPKWRLDEDASTIAYYPLSEEKGQAVVDATGQRSGWRGTSEAVELSDPAQVECEAP